MAWGSLLLQRATSVWEEKYEKRERKGKKSTPEGRFAWTPQLGHYHCYCKRPLSEFYKEKLPGEIHNLFLTSAAQLTNDSKAFSSVTSPTGCEEVGVRGTTSYLHSCARPLAGAGYLGFISGGISPASRTRARTHASEK